MKVVITGSSSGMGNECTKKFLMNGHEVHGLDILPPPDTESLTSLFHYHNCDVSDAKTLPEIEGCEILINNAGVQDSGRDIDINLKGVINCTQKYALRNPHIISVLNQASTAAHLGTDFPEYVASKGGVISYTKWTAKEIARFGATCNSLSFGGVITSSNNPVIYNQQLWEQVMNLTPLKRWCSLAEAAEWIYFMTVVNKSASGVDIIIDNLESLNGTFVW